MRQAGPDHAGSAMYGEELGSGWKSRIRILHFNIWYLGREWTIGTRWRQVG